MKTPVLIAARNEADSLARTLERMPQSVEPIVIPNGCIDATREIARRYGSVTVIGSPEEGKLPALQTGLAYLGRRALEPFFTVDGDTYPLLPAQWAGSMLAARQTLPTDKPALVTGPLILTGTDVVSTVYRSSVNFVRQFQNRTNKNGSGFCGANTLIDFQNQTTLEAAMALPHIWPGEDEALKDVVVDGGGNTYRSANLLAVVVTDGRRHPNLMERLRIGRAEAIRRVHDSYIADASPNSIPYETYMAAIAQK